MYIQMIRGKEGNIVCTRVSVCVREWNRKRQRLRLYIHWKFISNQQRYISAHWLNTYYELGFRLGIFYFLHAIVKYLCVTVVRLDRLRTAKEGRDGGIRTKRKKRRLTTSLCIHLLMWIVYVCVCVCTQMYTKCEHTSIWDSIRLLKHGQVFVGHGHVKAHPSIHRSCYFPADRGEGACTVQGVREDDCGVFYIRKQEKSLMSLVTLETVTFWSSWG